MSMFEADLHAFVIDWRLADQALPLLLCERRRSTGCAEGSAKCRRTILGSASVVRR